MALGRAFVTATMLIRFLQRLESEINLVIIHRASSRARIERLRVLLLAMHTQPGDLEDTLARAIELLDEPLPIENRE